MTFRVRLDEPAGTTAAATQASSNWRFAREHSPDIVRRMQIPMRATSSIEVACKTRRKSSPSVAKRGARLDATGAVTGHRSASAFPLLEGGLRHKKPLLPQRLASPHGLCSRLRHGIRGYGLSSLRCLVLHRRHLLDYAAHG